MNAKKYVSIGLLTFGNIIKLIQFNHDQQHFSYTLLNKNNNPYIHTYVYDERILCLTYSYRT